MVARHQASRITSRKGEGKVPCIRQGWEGSKVGRGLWWGFGGSLEPASDSDGTLHAASYGQHLSYLPISWLDR